TSSGDMKMLTRVAGPSTPRSSATATTRPSAGDTTRCSSPGGTRSGSRKNQRQNPTPTRSGTSAAGCPARLPTTPTSPSTPAAVAMTGQPSRAIVTRGDALLVARAVDETLRGEPRHERPELLADLLDGVLPRFS